VDDDNGHGKGKGKIKNNNKRLGRENTAVVWGDTSTTRDHLIIKRRQEGVRRAVG
jgi:hypothetical protein